MKKLANYISNIRLNQRLKEARGKHEFVDLLNTYPPSKRGLILAAAFKRDIYDLYLFHRGQGFESEIGSYLSYRLYYQEECLAIELSHPKAPSPFHTFLGYYLWQGVISCQEAIKQEFQA